MGVKSLWDLLAPVGRPVMLETMEGKTMAIDSSIWIYQFQATMRGKDGQVLVNAHVLGFLRRICKLMFYGMQPVFVFDGGAPALKKNTLTERRLKKSGAAASHAKLAEKLLAAQLRREALNHVSSKSNKGKGKVPDGSVVLDDDTVYLEDIDPSMPKSPTKKKSSPNGSPTKPPPKRNQFRDHDPYQLPDVDVARRVSEAARAAAPDPRLATEDELRTFIEDMRPEDFDITSPAFLELPTEVQYEIIGDLRLKSRQTSYSRLQQMLQAAPTPLDFSKQQIKNLRQRNALTQQLLATTDSIGKANIEIPVRIASERNKQYVLIKNQGKDGGWILGIRDDGTKDKPIVLDHEEEERARQQALEDDEDNDEDMEEVAIPARNTHDPDMRDYQRHNALGAIGNRASGVRAPTVPLFEADDFDEEDNDEEVALAIQRSLDETPRIPSPSFPHYDPHDFDDQDDFDDNRFASTSKVTVQYQPVTPRPSNNPIRFPHTPLGNALSLANTAPSLQHIITPPSANESTSLFGAPRLLAGRAEPISTHKPETQSNQESSTHLANDEPSNFLVKNQDSEVAANPLPGPETRDNAALIRNSTYPTQKSSSHSLDILRDHTPPLLVEDEPANAQDSVAVKDPPLPIEDVFIPSLDPHRDVTPPPLEIPPSPISISDTPPPIPKTPSSRSASPDILPAVTQEPLFLEDEMEVEKSPSPLRPLRSPSPAHSDDHLAIAQRSRPASPEEEEDWDAAQEMNPAAEEDEFARFISDVKGRDIDDVRKEIDKEISFLNQQRKAAMRDSADVTQQMINQIMAMLRLFGIPYITAPMEAEAQCAELVMLGLVDGIITDDSDVFLFGGERVFKNMFNQSKTVECFLSADLTRELGLDRGTLIRLAYLLGSDYVDGLPGVGPVVAMELLKEFPGDDGLHKFKDWWTKVQSGKDREEDTKSAFRKRFKKKFKDLYLGSDWPNSLVRDAYYHPTVDSSDEPFKWGLPDLDALRGFLHEELGWGQEKVDDLLVPVIQKARKRGQATTVNKQGNLNGFFDVAGGSGTIAPRKRQAYTSKRLQQVVSDYRKKRKAVMDGNAEDTGDESSASDAQPPPKKQKKSQKSDKAKAKGKVAPARWGRGRGRNTKSSGRKSSSDEPSDKDDFGEVSTPIEVPLSVELRPRPKPKPAYKGAPGVDAT